MDWFTALLTAGPAVLQAIFGAQSAKSQSASSSQALEEQRRQFDESMEWMRESAKQAQKGTELENIRRSQEARSRAARLEDVAGMLENVEGMQGMRDVGQRLLERSTDEGGLRDIITQLGELGDAETLRGIAAQMGPGGEADLRKAAMRELSRGSGAMSAMLAQQGVRGSGFAARQQREMATDTMMGLSQQLAQNRMDALMNQAGIIGRAGEFDMSRLGQMGGLEQQIQSNQLQSLLSSADVFNRLSNADLDRLKQIGDIFRDDAFGADLEYNPKELEDLYYEMMGIDRDAVAAPEAPVEEEAAPEPEFSYMPVYNDNPTPNFVDEYFENKKKKAAPNTPPPPPKQYGIQPTPRERAAGKGVSNMPRTAPPSAGSAGGQYGSDRAVMFTDW